MQLLTHSFKVTIFSNGKFCYKNPRWEKKEYEEILKDFKYSVIINALLTAILIFA